MIKEAFYEGYLSKCADMWPSIGEGAALGGVSGTAAGTGIELLRQALDTKSKDLNTKRLVQYGLGTGLGGFLGGGLGGVGVGLLDPSNLAVKELMIRVPAIAGSIMGARYVKNNYDTENGNSKHPVPNEAKA